MQHRPLDLSVTRDIGRIRHLIDTFPLPQSYFCQIQKAEYAWQNWEASEMKWRSEPRGGPLDHAFAPRKDWQVAEARKNFDVVEVEEEGEKKTDAVQRIFGDRIYTYGPDGRMDTIGDGPQLNESTKGVVPGINSIQDVERTLSDTFALCSNLNWLHWCAILYPLPKGVAHALDQTGTLETLILSNEDVHWGE